MKGKKGKERKERKERKGKERKERKERKGKKRKGKTNSKNAALHDGVHHIDHFTKYKTSPCYVTIQFSSFLEKKSWFARPRPTHQWMMDWNPDLPDGPGISAPRQVPGTQQAMCTECTQWPLHLVSKAESKNAGKRDRILQEFVEFEWPSKWGPNVGHTGVDFGWPIALSYMGGLGGSCVQLYWLGETPHNSLYQCLYRGLYIKLQAIPWYGKYKYDITLVLLSVPRASASAWIWAPNSYIYCLFSFRKGL